MRRLPLFALAALGMSMDGAALVASRRIDDRVPTNKPDRNAWGAPPNPHPHFIGMWKRHARRHGSAPRRGRK